MDNRYQKNYGMSTMENLNRIRSKGMHEFLEEQYRGHRCPGCSGLISVHNGKCFRCDPVTKLVEKNIQESDRKKKQSGEK